LQRWDLWDKERGKTRKTGRGEKKVEPLLLQTLGGGRPIPDQKEEGKEKGRGEVIQHTWTRKNKKKVEEDEKRKRGGST